MNAYIADLTRSIWLLEMVSSRSNEQQEQYLALLLERVRCIHRHDVKHTSGSSSYDARF